MVSLHSLPFNDVSLIARSPGRFFVQQELKLLYVYMLMNYDIQYLPERPPNFTWGPIHTPPPKTTLKVRRKAGTVS